MSQESDSDIDRMVDETLDQPEYLGTHWTDFDRLIHGRFSDPYFKVLWEGGKTKFFHRGILNKKACKVENFQVWVPKDNFE